LFIRHVKENTQVFSLCDEFDKNGFLTLIYNKKFFDVMIYGSTKNLFVGKIIKSKFNKKQVNLKI
jgi:hypothetical protein